MQKHISELLILAGGWAKFHREREVRVRDNVIRKAAGVFTIKQIIDFKTLYNMKIETCI